MMKIFLLAMCLVNVAAFSSESPTSLVTPPFDVQKDMKCSNAKKGPMTRHNHRQQGNLGQTFRGMTDQDFDLVAHSRN